MKSLKFLAKKRIRINNERGYVALTSVIIVSILAMVIALTLSFSSFSNRFNILDSETKERGNALAEGCAQIAFLKLSQNSSYAGGENISVDGNQCSILPIETNDTQKTIKIKTVTQNFVTNLKITVNSSDLSVASWTELPSL